MAATEPSTRPVPAVDERDGAAGGGRGAPLQRWTLAVLVTNVAIVLSGALVRLTGSGLGCPSWPTCNQGSFVPVPDVDHAPINQAIEFGNRLFSGVVLLVAIGALLRIRRELVARRDAARPTDEVARLVVPARLVVAGVVAQAIVGAFVINTDLTPLVVGFHFTASVVIIAIALVLHRRAVGHVPVPVPPPAAWLARAVAPVAFLVLALGTIVSGAGPHAGDADTARLAVDIRTMAVAHADLVWLLVGMTVATVLLGRALGVESLRRAATLLLVAELVQGGIGYLQYAMGIPAWLVMLHVVGSMAVWITALRVALAVRPEPGATVVTSTASQRQPHVGSS